MKLVQICSILLIFFFCFTISLFAERDGKKIIAVIRDDETDFYGKILDRFTPELKKLAELQYEFEFKDEFRAKGDSQLLKALIFKALRDPEVDMVYTAGVLSTLAAEKMTDAERIKPIVGGGIEFSDLDHGLISKSGTSKLKNFTFTAIPHRIQADIELVKKLSNSKVVHVLIDKIIYDHLKDTFDDDVASVEKRAGVDIKFIPVGGTIEECMAVIPKEVKAVYLPMLPHLIDNERADLLKALAARKVMTISMFGHFDVKKGAFAGLARENDGVFEKRSALNIHQILSGVDTSILPVTLSTDDSLLINLAVAKQIGWSPDYDISLSATFINEEALVKYAGNLTLESAMGTASKLSPDVLAARSAIEVEKWNKETLKTNFNPKLNISGSVGNSIVTDRISALTAYHSQSVSLGVEVSKLLYSDRVSSAIRAQAKSEEAAKFALKSARLDAIQRTASAYLDAIEAEALWEIEKENLLLSENNLQLAKLRQNIGAADASETFRWQAAGSQAKALLIRRDANRSITRIALNVEAGLKRTAQYRLKDIQLGNNDFYFLDNSLQADVENADEWQKFIKFVQQVSTWQSPELASFDKIMAGQGILLEERLRRNFRPEVSLSASARRLIAGGNNINTDGQNEWTVGVGFTIPLGDGGEKHTETRRIKAFIAQLGAQRKKAKFLTEQRSLTSAYSISASHANMRLTRLAREASQKNYDAVRSKYSQGAVSITTLLDAQSQLFSLRQAEASAVYQYLRDIINLQRSIAWYEFTKSTKEKRQFVQWFQNYKKTGSIHVQFVK